MVKVNAQHATRSGTICVSANNARAPIQGIAPPVGDRAQEAADAVIERVRNLLKLPNLRDRERSAWVSHVPMARCLSAGAKREPRPGAQAGVAKSRGRG